MTLPALVFVAGIALVQHWSRLPGVWEYGVIVALAFGCAYRRRWLVTVFLLGTFWAAVYADWRLSDQLDYERQGQDVVVQGYIASLPQVTDGRVGFDFRVTHADPGIPSKLRLSWYHPKKSVKAGQSWKLTLRLKRPHGRSNPGGFDYEAWLFANHIGATGYVRSKPEPVLIEADFFLSREISVWRQAISDRLDTAMPNSAQLGVIKALTLGSQDLITQQQWEIFRKSGIVHLMVISGSHISLVAGLVFLLVRRGWAWSGVLRFAPHNVAAVFAWLAALLYAALAGFSVPTQRALIMLTLGLWALVLQRNAKIGLILVLALLAVVLFDPLAVLSVGFWLSFAAVALLLYVSTGRIGRARYWRQAAKLHLTMALGLAPLLLVFFQQVSVVSPLANLLAVPIIGMLVTPLSLLGAGMAFLSPTISALILWPAEHLLVGLEWLLQEMAAWPLATLSSAYPPWYALVLGIVGVLLLFAPKATPGRYLSPFLLLPLMFVRSDKPRAGEWWFALLDVGQGLAAVVRTEKHALVFDTGAKYALQSDMGASVVLPYLRYHGINQLDALFISHADIDHSGGAATLLAELPVGKIYSSASPWAVQAGGQFCLAGNRWRWDGVDFAILSPPKHSFASENNNSCVLRISNAQQSVLLTGDIEQEAEESLRKTYGHKLVSSVLVAPHHGSKTSSSRALLQQVRPEMVLIPAGYANRFGFPHAEVLERYREQGATYFSSADEGAIELKALGSTFKLTLARRDDRRYWMAKPIIDEVGVSVGRVAATPD